MIPFYDPMVFTYGWFAMDVYPHLHILYVPTRPGRPLLPLPALAGEWILKRVAHGRI